MKFPSNLRPKWYYKFINEIEPNWIFQRATLKKSENQESRLINPEIIASPAKHLLNYSVNLLGEYKDENKSVTLTNEGKKLFDVKWKEFCITSKPKHQRDFEFNSEKGALYFFVNDILGTDYDLNYKGNDFKIVPIIKHDPMKWNFWHFEISWKVSPNDHIPTSNNGRRDFDREVAHAIRASFQYLANDSCEIAYNLNESIYKKDNQFVLFIKNFASIMRNSDFVSKFR